MSGGAPGEPEKALRLDSGPFVQPESHDGHASEGRVAHHRVGTSLRIERRLPGYLVRHEIGSATIRVCRCARRGFTAADQGSARCDDRGVELEVIAGHGDVLCLPLAAVPIGNAVGSEGTGRERRTRGVELTRASVADLGTGRLPFGQRRGDREEAVVGVARLGRNLVRLDLPDRAASVPEPRTSETPVKLVEVVLV